MSPIPDERYSGAPSNPPQPVAGSVAPVDENECVTRFWERVRLFALRRTGDRVAAEDVAQETLRRVVEALRGGRVANLIALPSFVFQTALHVCQHHSRSAGREGRALLRLHRTTGDPPSAGDPLHGLIGDEQRAEVRRAMGEMDERDQQLLRMLYYEQLDTAEAARRLGITVGALRVRKHRVLERLRETLNHDRGHTSG
ncbi:MAG TPA: sigma-70 family RNA polymerase sigma factor [Gemmatimonadales bacterium]|jgi:RNA polymerase sigma-70 factor (ECF subfamily)